MNGRTHLNGQFNENEQIINLSNMHSGFYILELRDDKNNIKSVKLSLH
ncbi:MAG: T9SS type A sorting domain-containing protein [Flavobacteriales bacterium]